MEFLYVILSVLVLDTMYLYNTKNGVFKMLKDIQKEDVIIKKFPLLIIYLLIGFGIYYFIVKPRKSIEDAFMLGVVVYGIYEFTNYAILNDWGLLFTLMDTFWGGVLFAGTTYITYKIVGVKKI